MISIVIPVHNEAPWIEELLGAIVADLKIRSEEFEVVLIENGSSDHSGHTISEAIAAWPELIRSESYPWSDYGRALRTGLLKSRGERVIAVDLDNWNAGFFDRALRSLADGAVLVVGYKSPALDRRSALRRWATQAQRRLIGGLFPDVQDLDTHGSIVFDRKSLEDVLKDCSCTGDFFKVEFIARAARAGVAIKPIAVETREKRPARTGLMRRSLSFLWGLPSIWKALRGGPSS